MRGRGDDIEERIEGTIRAQRQWNAGGDQRLQRLHPGLPHVTVADVLKHVANHQVRRVLHDHHAERLRACDQIRRQHVAVLERGRLAARFRARRPIRARRIGLDRGIADGVMASGSSQPYAQPTNRSICSARNSGARVPRRVRIGLAHGGEPFDRRAVEIHFMPRISISGRRLRRQRRTAIHGVVGRLGGSDTERTPPATARPHRPDA